MPRRAAIALLWIAVVAVYANSFDGAFVFDDFPSIVENPHVRTVWPLSQSMTAPPEVTTAGRPVAALTFAFNYAQGLYDTWWYHATNVAIHACAALALFGIVRRTLLTPALRPAFGSASTTLAFLVSLLWAIHPLQTQAVTYIVQRVESLMGLFLLLMLYSAIRGWIAIAVICCALGMATKQTMIGAPLIVLAWDRLFGSKMRWKLYAALASTWLLLAWLVASEPRPHSVGSIDGWTPVTYLWTQAGVILHYLRLSVFPVPLIFDYDWRPSRGLAQIAIPVLAIAALMAATMGGMARRRPWAFAGAWFFVILAPTSSVLPIVTEVAAEHRMYLPVAAVLALVILGAHKLGARLRWPWLVHAVAGCLLVLFAVQTVSRNRVYESDERIWIDTISRRPSNARAQNNYAVDLLRAGRISEAETHARRAVEVNADMAEAHQTLGVVLLTSGRADEGIDHLERARELDPTNAKTHQNLGEAYGAKGDLGAAVLAFLDGAQYAPDDPAVLNRAGWILATAAEPRLRDGGRALSLASHAVELTRRQDVVSLDTLAAAHAELGQFDAAVAAAREALTVARAKGDTAMLPELQQRLDLYTSRRPFRQ